MLCLSLVHVHLLEVTKQLTCVHAVLATDDKPWLHILLWVLCSGMSVASNNIIERTAFLDPCRTHAVLPTCCYYVHIHVLHIHVTCIYVHLHMVYRLLSVQAERPMFVFGGSVKKTAELKSPILREAKCVHVFLSMNSIHTCTCHLYMCTCTYSEILYMYTYIHMCSVVHVIHCKRTCICVIHVCIV